MMNDDYRFLQFEKRCKEYKITPGEKEIIREIIDGLEVKEIANKLFITIHTVKKHMRSVYTKCRVQNRVELYNRFKE